MKAIRTTLAAIALLAAASTAIAQPPVVRDYALERYELGRRLKTFEDRWEKTESTAARNRAAARLADAHALFLTLRFAEAARILDRATHALESDEPAGLAKQWAASLAAVPASRVVDGETKELAVVIRPIYPIKGDPPKNLEVQLWFHDKQVVTAKPQRFPFEMKLPLPPLGDANGLDRTLYCLVETDRTQRHYTIGIAQVKRRDERLAALKKATEAWPIFDTIEKATAHDRAAQLASLAAGTVEETDVPVANLLENAERMLKGPNVYSANMPGEYWLSVPLGGKKTAPVRVFVPRGLTDQPVPVVVGLHGAGGSENLFFEGYGAGQAVSECRRRGWVFVATRSGLDFAGAPPVPAILDELAKRYPLDPKRTFLIGHSMGAGQTATLAAKHAGRFAGIACLGGGGAVRDTAAFATLPTFIAAGARDFGLPPAKALFKTLDESGAKNLTFKEYPGLEHLLIVREALPDVFKRFESIAGKK